MTTDTDHTISTEAHEAGHWSDLKYVQLAIGLAVITAIEVAISYQVDNLGALFLPVLLGLMLIKFFSVVLYFMHLKFDSNWFSFMFYVGIGLSIMVYFGTLMSFEFFSK